MNEPLHYKNYDSSADFDRARFQLSTPFQYIDIALDVAASNQQIEIAGDFLYVDTVFDGVVTIELNIQQDAPMAPFQIKAGFAMEALFKKLKVSWAAQPGKKIRILYSTGQKIIPSLTGSLIITGIVNTLEDGISYNGSYKSIASLASGTAEVVFAAAANINGALVYRSEFWENSATVHVFGAFLEKATAPLLVTDGNVLCGVSGSALMAGNFATFGKSEKTFKIPAGRGLFYITNALAIASQRSCLYTLL